MCAYNNRAIVFDSSKIPNYGVSYMKRTYNILGLQDRAHQASLYTVTSCSEKTRTPQQPLIARWRSNYATVFTG